jgi:hypothetical protein
VDRATGESSSCERTGQGSIDLPVVLAVRFDCRSRRAARGIVRPRAKSSRKRRSLALPHCSEGRKSVGSRSGTAKSRARWRAHVRGASCKRRTEWATRRWKALRAGKVASFDEEATEAVLAVLGEFRLQECRDRKRQRQVLPPRARLTRPSRRGAVRGVHRSRDPNQERTVPAPASDDVRSVVDPAEAGVRTVKCAATRVVRWGFGSNGRVARANSAGATSRVERTCRCSCRDSQLQTSVRSIFLVGKRSAERQASTRRIA